MNALLQRLSYKHQIVVDVLHDDGYHPLLNTVRLGAVGKVERFEIDLIEIAQTLHLSTLCLTREGSDILTTATMSPSQSSSLFLLGLSVVSLRHLFLGKQILIVAFKIFYFFQFAEF